MIQLFENSNGWNIEDGQWMSGDNAPSNWSSVRPRVIQTALVQASASFGLQLRFIHLFYAPVLSSSFHLSLTFP